MADHSPHQQKIISRYYDHRDQIMLGRLQEIVTDLTLAETDKRCDQLWKRAITAMEKLKIQPRVLNRIVEQRDPELLARNVREWLGSTR